MKKMINCFLCSVMLIGLLFPITVSAAENESSFCTNNIAEHVEDEFSAKAQEANMRIVNLDMLQEVGDEQIIGIWNGEVYRVKVVDVTEYSATPYGIGDNTVKSKSFLYTKTNALGVETKLLGVTAKLRWIKNTKITSFDCSHIIYDSRVRASWRPDYTTQTDVLWTRMLDVIWENGQFEVLQFGGSLMTVDGKDFVDINSSTGLGM